MKFLEDILADANAYEGDNIFNDVPSFVWDEEATAIVAAVLSGTYTEWAVVESADQGSVLIAYSDQDFQGSHGEPWRYVGTYEKFTSEYDIEIEEYLASL